MDILQKYKEYATGSTDAPSKYHDYCAAALVGAALGRGLHYQHGHIRLYPHLWVCLVGQSTLMKKSTSIRIAETLLARVNDKLLLPAKFTVEKLYQMLSENPVGMVTYSELHSLLSMMGRDYNVELKSTMADFWDSPPVKGYTTLGGGTVTVKHPAFTILAGSTADWLSEAARTRDIQGGFYPRWLFSIASASDQPDMPLPPPRNESKADAIVQELVAISQTYNVDQGDRGQMTMTPKAQAAYKQIYSDFRKTYGNDPLLGPFAGRGQIYVIKLGMISAMARKRSLSIDADDLEYGFDMVKNSMKDVAELCKYELAETKTDGHLNRYRRMLKEAGIAGMTKRDLLKNGPVRMTDYFDKMLKSLTAQGHAKIIPGKRRDSEVVVSLELGPAKEGSNGRHGEPSSGASGAETSGAVGQATPHKVGQSF